MFDAVVWGLVQGLTEFLPISSSGHLVLVPAVLRDVGLADLGDPDLATSVVLHLGTLVAVVWYYRADLIALARRPLAKENRFVLELLVIGTVPAVVGLPLAGALERIEETPRWVALALVVTGLVLATERFARPGTRSIGGLRRRDALLIGVAQATALIPGISRSGATIVAGRHLGMIRAEAARYSVLLAIPAIAGGGLVSMFSFGPSETGAGPLVVGFVVAALSGYAAIAFLIRLLVRRGLGSFVAFCAIAGGVSFALL